MAIEIGSTVTGTVVKVADYGAIIRLAGGSMGLVHISEVADTYVSDIRDHLRENDRILVKVLRLNDKGRYELSAKQADRGLLRDHANREDTGQNASAGKEHSFSLGHGKPSSFEDRLNRFMRESEDRLHDLKRNIEGKRGGGRK